MVVPSEEKTKSYIKLLNRQWSAQWQDNWRSWLTSHVVLYQRTGHKISNQWCQNRLPSKVKIPNNEVHKQWDSTVGTQILQEPVSSMWDSTAVTNVLKEPAVSIRLLRVLTFWRNLQAQYGMLLYDSVFWRNLQDPSETLLQIHAGSIWDDYRYQCSKGTCRLHLRLYCRYWFSARTCRLNL